MPEQTPRGPGDWMRQLAVALDLPFMLVGAVMGGGFIGYVLDQWLHTEPWLMLILGGLGFVAGMRAVLQTIAHGGGKPPGETPDGGRPDGQPPGGQAQ